MVKLLDIHWGGDAALADFDLSATGSGMSISGTSGQPAVTAAEVLAGTYALDEDGPTGYLGQGWACIGGSQDGDDITLGVGEEATCTVTNADEPGQIIVVKQVINDDGGVLKPGDFSLTLDGLAVVSGGVNNVFTDTSHTATEVDIPTGYEWVSTSCVITGTDTPIGDGGVLTVSEGQSATCTVVNDDLAAPVLTLVKEVVTDDGGNAQPTDWTLTADDGGDGADLSGPAFVSGNVTAGANYALTEDGPDGYTTDGYSCVGDGIVSSDSESVTLNYEADVTCTIVNDDVPASITVVKEFENETEVDPDAFLLTVNDGAVASGVTTEFAANQVYTVGETVLEGWTQTGLECMVGEQEIANGFTLELGTHVTCVITNGENPTVTVEKVTDIATEDLFDFVLNGDTQAVASGGSYTWNNLTPGEYSLTENLTSEAWELEGYECDVQAADLGNGMGFGLSWGDHVTCVFGNLIAPIDIQVEKTDRVDPIILSDDNPVGLIEYDIVVTNNGPAADPSVTAVDTLPPSLTFVSVVTDTGTCAYVAIDHTIECDFGAMDSGAVVNIYVVMQTETLGSVTDIFPFNEVTVTGVREDINLDNNTDDEVTTIIEVEALCDEDDDDPDCLPETGADIEGPVAAGLAFLLFGSLLAVLARKENEEGVTT